jgi:hypothetical protein
MFCRMPQVLSANEISKLATDAATLWIRGECPSMNQAVAQVVKTAGSMNREQVGQVVHLANRQSYLMKHGSQAGESHRIVEFPGGVARVEEVIKQATGLPQPTTYHDLSDYQSSPATKQASWEDLFGVEKFAEEAPPLPELTLEKLARNLHHQVKEAQNELDLEQLYLDTSRHELVDQMKVAHRAGASLGEISKLLGAVDSDPGFLKAAFYHSYTDLYRVGRHTPETYEESIKQASLVVGTPNLDHPLCAAYASFIEHSVKVACVQEALRELEQAHKIANDPALAAQMEDEGPGLGRRVYDRMVSAAPAAGGAIGGLMGSTVIGALGQGRPVAFAGGLVGGTLAGGALGGLTAEGLTYLADKATGRHAKPIQPEDLAAMKVSMSLWRKKPPAPTPPAAQPHPQPAQPHPQQQTTHTPPPAPHPEPVPHVAPQAAAPAAPPTEQKPSWWKRMFGRSTPSEAPAQAPPQAPPQAQEVPHVAPQPQQAAPGPAKPEFHVREAPEGETPVFGHADRYGEAIENRFQGRAGQIAGNIVRYAPHTIATLGAYRAMQHGRAMADSPLGQRVQSYIPFTDANAEAEQRIRASYGANPYGLSMPIPKIPSAFVDAGKSFGGIVHKGLEAAAGTAIVGGAVVGGQAAYDYLTKARDYKRMMNSPFNSDLQQFHQERPEHFNAAFTGLRRMNADLTREPMVAGTYMRRMMEFGPTAAGGVLVEALGQRERMQSPLQDAIVRGGQAGIQGVLNEQMQNRNETFRQDLQLKQEQKRLDLGYEGQIEAQRGAARLQFEKNRIRANLEESMEAQRIKARGPSDTAAYVDRINLEQLRGDENRRTEKYKHDLRKQYP